MRFGRGRLITTVAVGAVAVATTIMGSGAGAAVPDSSQYGTVLNILPPGSNGNTTAADLAALGAGNVLSNPGGLLGNPAGAQRFFTTATPTTPTNFADQLEMYDGINKVNPATLTDSQLGSYFKDAPLGVKDSDVVRTETPKPGVTIKWDRYGVPHIYGVTDQDVAYGAGVAGMEDRMFLTDALRHTGDSDMASFVGATTADIAQDAAQLQVAPYTTAQDDAMIATLLKQNPVEGKALLDQVNGYLAGINDEIKTLCPFTTLTPLPGGLGLGFGVNCPVEYAALQRPPQPYTIHDVIAIASLVGGIFGTGGGGQYTNAIWLQQLQEKYGVTEGTKLYNDLREKNDPETPTTSPNAAPYGGGSVDQKLPGVAMPDLHPTRTQLGTGAIVNSDGSLSAPPSAASAPGNQGNASTTPPHMGVNPQLEAEGVMGALARAQAGQLVGMSNELMVDAKHSAGGHPIAVFGPQTGYYAPQLLMEEELEGPSIAARGVAFSGTNFVVELGHGIDYAWSATSPYTDITDTVVQKLCNLNGSKASVDSVAYINEAGKCTAMTKYVHSEQTVPNIESTSAPQTINFLVLRTDHGIVQLRTTVKGAPVAVSLLRSTYGNEIGSVLGFSRLNNPTYMKTPAHFAGAISAIQYAFNWYYIDSKNIAYQASALLPKRSAQVDFDLPRWAQKAYDWSGFVPTTSLPHVTNPARGYIVNWNNKLAPQFASSSEVWGDGAVYRVQTLIDRVTALIKSGKPVTRSGLAAAMIDAATVDVRAAYDLPLVLDTIGTPTGDPKATAAIALLKTWLSHGSHRVDRARTGSYVDQAAIELFDTWWNPVDSGACSAACGFALPLDELRGGLGSLVDKLPEPLDDPPTEHIGSAYNGISWMGYISKDLRTLLGKPVSGKFSKVYCGAGSLSACRSALLSSLDKAINAALATQKVSSVSQLTYDKTRDDILSVAGGVTGVRAIDWQNRPTFQQVVQWTKHR